MIGTNYKAWDVNIDDFKKITYKEDKIKFLLNFAVLSPSSHNSQPWKFSIKNNSLSVYIDPLKKLKVGDKDNRLLFISMGCVIANITIAADYYGLLPIVRYLPDHDKECLVAIITFNETVPQKEPKEHLIFSIPKRSVNRGKYKNELPSGLFLENIKSLSEDNLKIHFIVDSEERDTIADAVVHSSIDIMENKEFRKELYHYIKNNLTKSKIGIPAFGMGIPTILSLVTPLLVKYFNMDKFSKNTYKKLLKKHTSLFMIISTKHDKEVDWIKTGEIYQNIALTAEQYKLKTAVWGAPVLLEKYYKKIQKVLKTDYRPQMFFRVGYPQKHQPHSPRLSVSDVLEN